MATKDQIRRWFQETRKRFIKVYPFAEDATFELILSDKKTCVKDHQEAVAKAKAKPSEYMSNTAGETIAGSGGCYILIYVWEIQNKVHFQRVLWHEMGHCCDNMINMVFRDHTVNNFDENDLICCGYTVWSEFIAELMYYEVADQEPLPVFFPVLMDLQQLLFGSFANNCFFPYTFGQYAAKVVNDSTVSFMMKNYPGDVDVGLDLLRDEVADAVIEVLAILDEQFCQDEYWIATEDFMRELGAAVNVIWDRTEHGEVFIHG